jgi:hypothetical protein
MGAGYAPMWWRLAMEGEGITAPDAFGIVRDLAMKLAVPLHIIPRQ